jgi:RimJ/RimL family protein N-acetyltransferase
MELEFKEAIESQTNTIYKNILRESENGHFNPTYAGTKQGKREALLMIYHAINNRDITMQIDGVIKIIRPELITVTYHSEIIGFMYIAKTENITELLFVSVFPKFRGKGFGIEICKHFVDANSGKKLVARCKKKSVRMRSILKGLKFIDDKTGVGENINFILAPPFLR